MGYWASEEATRPEYLLIRPEPQAQDEAVQELWKVSLSPGWQGLLCGKQGMAGHFDQLESHSGLSHAVPCGTHLMGAVLNGSFHIMLHADSTLLSFSRAHVYAAPHLHKAEHVRTAAIGTDCTFNTAVSAPNQSTIKLLTPGCLSWKDLSQISPCLFWFLFLGRKLQDGSSNSGDLVVSK